MYVSGEVLSFALQDAENSRHLEGVGTFKSVHDAACKKHVKVFAGSSV